MLTAVWLVCYGLVVLGLTVYGLHRYLMLGLYFWHKRHPLPQPPEPAADAWPVVSVQLPVFNEYHVVERLIRSVASMDYPRDRLQIMVLDDSTDESQELAARLVEEYAAQGFDIMLRHRTDRTGFKAGALREAMPETRGEYITIFDADFLPPKDFLKKTVPHLVANPKVGLVQTRWGHLNAESSLLTRLQSLFLNGHLLIEQTARCRGGRFFNFNGTAGVWRAKAILDAGNWQHDTLTEDLDLSYRAQINGWRFLFLPDVVTPAELPADMPAFKTQQHRWAKGSIQTARKILPVMLTSKLPTYLKLEALIHLSSNAAYLLLICLCILLHPLLIGPYREPQYFWIVDVPIFCATTLSLLFFYSVAIIELSKRPLRDLLCLPALLGLGVGMAINNSRAVLEAIIGHESPFARTPKYGFVGRARQIQSGALRYFSLRNMLPVVEASLAIYYLYFLYWAVWKGQWVTVPFLFMFLMGFAYVAALTLWPSATMPKVSAALDHNGAEQDADMDDPLASEPVRV